MAIAIGYEIQPVGNKFQKYMAGTKAVNPATTSAITLVGIERGFSISASNDGTVRMGITFGSKTANDILVDPDEHFSANFSFLTVYISNATTTTVQSRYTIFGV